MPDDQQMTLDHAVVGSVVPPDTGDRRHYRVGLQIGSSSSLARGAPAGKISRVEFIAAAAVLAVELRWSLERGRACSAVR